MALYSDINYIKPSLGSMLYDANSVFQSIFSILGTKKGKRVFRPNWGGKLNNYLFEPCDEITARSIFYDLSNTIASEPRILFNSSKSSVVPVPDKKLFLITIVYTVLGFSDTEKTLVLTLKQKDNNI